MVAGQPDRIIEAKDIGQTIGGPEGYRGLLISKQERSSE
jgi:hypothetical protein